MRVVLSDGSGLTARQAATQLAAGGHEVGVLSADPFGLARFTRHVRRVHRVPAFGTDPLGWLDAALRVLDRERAAQRAVDVLLPTQEQVAVLALRAEKVRERGTAIAVPAFDAVAQVLDKVSASRTLTALGVPQPAGRVVAGRAELLAQQAFPMFVKRPIGTATSGVTLVRDEQALRVLVARLPPDDFGALLVQDHVPGPLVMVQGVFDAGRLVAWHACLRERVGARGSASSKRSVRLPAAIDHLRRIGEALSWHGALALDVIVPVAAKPSRPATPLVIDVNPRLVEPGNAWRAGIDLVSAMLAVSCGGTPDEQPPDVPEVRTHQLLLALLAAAERGRGAVLGEALAAAARRGGYARSGEELTPARGDLRALLPVAAVVGLGVVYPPAAHHLAGGAVSRYALTPEGWRRLQDTAAHR